MQSHGVSETFRMRGCQTLEEPLAGIEDILVRNWFGCLFDSPFRAVKCNGVDGGNLEWRNCAAAHTSSDLSPFGSKCRL